MTPDTFKVMRALADELIATCEPQKFWDRLSELTMEEAKALDTMALECETCNQFYDAADMHETGSGYVCGDCR